MSKVFQTCVMYVCILFGVIWAFAQAERSFKPKPNIIFLLNDDQDLTLGGATPMQFTQQFMSDGAEVENFFVNTPVCCPSRTTLLTGDYPHNWHTIHGGCMHMNVVNPSFEQSTIGVYMQRLGYTTGMFGKLLNPNGVAPYCKKENAQKLPGFDSYLTMCNDNRYFKNSFSQNGSYIEKGDKPEDYLTSVIGNHSTQFVEASLQAGRPFFVYIAPHAPHVPATPAPWYANEYKDRKAPRTPNYNYSATDHHYVIRSQPSMTDDQANDSDNLFRNRWRSLLSVDDITKELVDLLNKYDQMDNTYFIWTSDHGYQLGQFRLPSCKLQPYDHDIRVPFHARGPGIKTNKFSFVAGMVDVAPTIIALAGGKIPEEMDGHSFSGMLLELPVPCCWTDKHIIEYWTLGNVVRYGHYIDMPNNTYIAVRLINNTHNYLYAEFYKDGEEETFSDKPFEYELFDVDKDPYQLKNLYGNEDNDELVIELHEYLHKQVHCKGQKEC